MVVKVHKENESFLRIDAPKEVIYSLSDAFTFFADNYKFHPKYKNRLWDGKIRLLNGRTKQLGLGLLYYLLKEFKTQGIDYELSFPIPTEELIPVSTDDWNTPFLPYDYQATAVKDALKAKKSIIESPTGSGKSFIIYLWLRNLLREYPNKRALIIVDRTSLVEQMANDFREYGLSVDPNVHLLYEGRDKTVDKPITIATWQTLNNLPSEYFEKFSFLSGDECHLYDAKCLLKIVNSCINAEYRLGTTGSLKDGKVHILQLKALFGIHIKTKKTAELIKEGRLSPFKIQMLLLQHPRKKFKSYQDEIDHIIELKNRTNFIKNLTTSLEGNTLILFDYVERHGKELHDVIATIPNKKVFFVTGDMKVPERERIRGLLEGEQGCIVIATLSLFSTGINIKNLHNLILATPKKSKIKVLQSIGRLLRISPDGKPATLYDIVDNFQTSNIAMKHAYERIKIYDQQEFPYKIHKIAMPK